MHAGRQVGNNYYNTAILFLRTVVTPFTVFHVEPSHIIILFRSHYRSVSFGIGFTIYFPAVTQMANHFIFTEGKLEIYQPAFTPHR